MKRAMITGADGFIGRHMTWYLRDLGWETNICDSTFGYGVVEMVAAHSVGMIPPYDLVVHAAAVGPNRLAIDTQPDTFIYNSYLDAKMFDWVVRTGQRRFVYLSSSAVYPRAYQDSELTSIKLAETDVDWDDPAPAFDDYGECKLHGERMAFAARLSGAKVTVVRPFSGYGSDQSADFPFGAFVARAKRREDPFTIWGSAKQTRDFVHVDDICAAIMAIVDADVVDPVNICTGVGTTMMKLRDLVCETAGYEPDTFVDGDSPLGVMRRVGDPTFMQQFYTPRVTLHEGVTRAF